MQQLKQWLAMLRVTVAITVIIQLAPAVLYFWYLKGGRLPETWHLFGTVRLFLF